MANKEQLAILMQGVEVWNEWRAQNPTATIDLRAEDLRDANLRGAILRGADFGGTYLWNANLKEVDLSGAHLAADLTNADLSGAWLYDTDFYGAYLKGAHLNETRLIGSIFRKASLEDADLTNAICGGLIFADTDMTNVKGLETLRHLGPSTIGIDTLLRTKTRLPDVFLRGCGIPQALIDKLPDLLATDIEFYRCFISHSSEDTDDLFAQRVLETLRSRGIPCWHYKEHQKPGADLYEQIHNGMDDTDKTLLCCSRSSLGKSWWVDMEINETFDKERIYMAKHGQKMPMLIALNLDGYVFSEEYDSGKAAEIRSRIAADFTGWEHDNAIFEREIEHVIKALRTDGGKEPPPKSKL